MGNIFTAREAAAYLGYSLPSLQLWRCQGGGPRYIKINHRSIRYRRQDLDDWINQFGTRWHTSQTAPDPHSRKKIERLCLNPEVLGKAI